MDNQLLDLQAWYTHHCNGEWEHQNGIKIGTLDNPGWEVVVDLGGTELAGVPFEACSVERSDSMWLKCRVIDDRFEGFGGPGDLEGILTIFLRWSRESSKK